MKKSTKKIVEIGLPVALILSGAWNANANVQTISSQEQITNESKKQDMYISENETPESDILPAVYSCRNSCMSSCGGSCNTTCERSCIGSCGGSCNSTCTGSCRGNCGSTSSYSYYR